MTIPPPGRGLESLSVRGPIDVVRNEAFRTRKSGEPRSWNEPSVATGFDKRGPRRGAPNPPSEGGERACPSCPGFPAPGSHEYRMNRKERPREEPDDEPARAGSARDFRSGGSSSIRPPIEPAIWKTPAAAMRPCAPRSSAGSRPTAKPATSWMTPSSRRCPSTNRLISKVPARSSVRTSCSSRSAKAGWASSSWPTRATRFAARSR